MQVCERKILQYLISFRLTYNNCLNFNANNEYFKQRRVFLASFHSPLLPSETIIGPWSKFRFKNKKG